MQIADLRHLCTLFSKDKALLTNEVQILYPVHADELGDGFTIQQVKEFNVGMKNNNIKNRE